MKYTASQIKNWDTTTEINGRWIPARPESCGFISYMLRRVKNAWFVLIGKYDALDWEEA